MSTPRGFASSLMQGESRGQHATVEPTGQYQNGLSVNALIFAYQVGSDTAETGSTAQIINATAHVARVGDVVRFAAGVLDKDEQKVVETGADWIKVASPFSAAPTNGDTFLIFRPRYAQSDEDGNLQVSVSQGPTQFVLNSVDTEVEEDTGTPSNSKPLPVKVFRDDGTSDWADDVEASFSSIESSSSATAADVDALNANFGSAADSAASTDTATATFVALFKRSLQHLSTLIAKDFSTETTLQAVDGWLNQLNSVFGLQNDSAASSDTGTFSFMALFKRSLEKLSLIETNTSDSVSELQSIDTTLGTLATETTLAGAAVDIASIDTKTPALGQAAMAASVPVVLASDQSAIPTAQSTAAASTVKQAAIAVGTTAVRITHDGSAPSAGRRLLAFRPDPDSTAKFYYGSSSVTSGGATRGMQVFPGESIEREFDAGDYYIISDTAAQTVFVVEQE